MRASAYVQLVSRADLPIARALVREHGGDWSSVDLGHGRLPITSLPIDVMPAGHVIATVHSAPAVVEVDVDTSIVLAFADLK